MKALSLTQPWASLMACGEKAYETRSWPTSYRGPLAIHASKGFPRDCQELCWQEPFRSALARHGYRLWSDLPLGVIIAVVDVVGCYPTTEVPDWEEAGECERAFGDYSAGRFAIITRDAQRIVPVPAKGRLGLWDHAFTPAPLAAAPPEAGYAQCSACGGSGQTAHRFAEPWPIDRIVEWARGGDQTDMFDTLPDAGCMRWGMCEPPDEKK